MMKARAYFTRRRGNSIRSEQGTSLVEFAMSMGILFCVILGFMQLAMAMLAYNFTAEAARMATRYAAVRGAACTGLPNCGMQSGDVTKWVNQSGYPFASTMSVSTTWACAPAANPCVTNGPGSTVTVTVSTPFPIVLPLPFQSNSTLNYTLSSTSQMVISQ